MAGYLASNIFMPDNALSPAAAQLMEIYPPLHAPVCFQNPFMLQLLKIIHRGEHGF
jgi:hypothetical protein